MIPLPTPDAMAGYERLGIVGILLLLLLTGVGLFLWVMRWGNQLSERHFQFLQQQTGVMKELTNSMDSLKDELARLASGQDALHRRIDQVLLCRHASCPFPRDERLYPNQPPH